MTDMTPSALIKHVRETAGPAALRNLAPIALAIGMADGHSPDDPDAWYSQSMTVSPMVNPILEALLDYHDATRRGRATWQIGYGEDTPTGALPVLLDSARPGTVWFKHALLRSRKPRDLTADRLMPKAADWNRLRHSPVGRHVTEDRIRAHQWRNHYRDADTRFAEARFGIISLNSTPTSLWISVHSTQHLVLPEHLADEIGDVPLDLWQVGRGFRAPTRVYPAQALAVAEWAARNGLALADPGQSGALGKFRQLATSSVVAWPRRGRPAQATISVGANVPKSVRAALKLKGAGVRDGRSTTISQTDSRSLAEALRGLEGVERLVHPAVLDAAALAAAGPIEDEAEQLRSYQRLAVGLHMATSVGYVNASSPGLGKTIMVLDAMRRRAQKTSCYRGLVVAEANVRAQWSAEAATWFPGATVVRVESRSHTDRLAEVLAEAGPFPVLVVTSYNLASTAMDVAGAVEIIDDADLNEDELSDDEEAAPETEEPAAVNAPAPVPVAKAPMPLPVPDGEPQDLLQMLAVLLSNEQAPQCEADDDIVGVDTADEETSPALGEVLLSQYWHDIVADEAVTLSSTSSKQSKALWRLRAQSQVAVALTGTPIKKGTNDLGSLMSWARNDRRLFHGIYSLEAQFDLSDDAQLRDFTEALGPMLFRRDKSEIQDELPDVESKVVVLEPTVAERALANAARCELKRAYEELVAWLSAVAEVHEDSAEYQAAKQSLADARSAWLGGTTLARMASSDPAAMLTAKGAGAALLQSQGLVAAATAQAGTKRTAVVTDVIDRVSRGERVLIFTEFATVARGLIEDLDASGLRVGRVLGGGGAMRDRHIVEFRNGELDVLVCTSAGERGLNLQTATTLIHYDLPWTPQGIIQRMGRLERIGATAEKILVVFPVMAGTIEERVASVVVARAATMMRALDSARGVDARRSDVGRALGSLASVARDDEVKKGEAALLQITRELLAA